MQPNRSLSHFNQGLLDNLDIETFAIVESDVLKAWQLFFLGLSPVFQCHDKQNTLPVGLLPFTPLLESQIPYQEKKNLSEKKLHWQPLCPSIGMSVEALSMVCSQSYFHFKPLPQLQHFKKSRGLSHTYNLPLRFSFYLFKK